ncbi:MAG: serine/threonine-protein kinase, partial [Pirellulaceae bacterium]
MEPTERTYRQGDEPVAGYQLQSFLGRGGFGEVWKAIGPGGVPSAVKIIHDLDRKHGGKELRALRLLRDIRHPNLVPLIAYWLKTKEGEILADEGTLQSSGQQFDTEVLRQSALSGCESRGTLLVPAKGAAVVERPEPAELVIAMGLAERSLFDRLQECRAAGLPGVPVEELLTYLEDAARAIDLLNARHEIQHCDIKPQNILLLSGAAQVCDFGLAKMIGEVRETSMGAGTIAYGAPEVLLGKGPTTTTDQYSLAISYFELRTGELPFGSEWISEVLQAKQSGAMDLTQLPAPERNVLARAASLDPSRRFTSCVEMVRALRQATNSSATTTCAEIPSLVDTHSEIRLPVVGYAVRTSSSGAAWKWAGMGAIGAALMGSGVMWAVLAEIRPGHAVTCPDGEHGSPVAPVFTAPDAAAELDIARELRRADEVLAEADATLAAAKAALAATQLAHQETPAAGNEPASPMTLLPAVQSVAAHAEAIADTSQETAQTTREIAASTKDNALEMEQLRQQLSQAT